LENLFSESFAFQKDGWAFREDKFLMGLNLKDLQKKYLGDI
jgi:hypothetical protein